MWQKETVQSISGSVTLQQSGKTILDIERDLHISRGLTLPKEVRVGGNVQIDEDVTLRALKADGDVFLATRVTVERWIDAGGRLVISEQTSAGERATAVTEIIVDPGVHFRVLAAPLIRVGQRQRVEVLPKSAAEGRAAAEFADARRSRIRADGTLIVEGDFTLPDKAVVIGDVVARGGIYIGRGALIIGSLHSDTEIVLEEESVVSGSVFAEDSLIIGSRAAVTEHALTRGKGRTHEDVRIGTVGRVTTLMARRGLEITAGTLVYGRIVASDGGITVASGIGKGT
jgi:carbonic anhydrase/acetyltransferase-like protein (isoleucine patch superfamily)